MKGQSGGKLVTRRGVAVGAKVVLAGALFCPLWTGVGQIAPASQASDPRPTYGGNPLGRQTMPNGQTNSGRPPFGSDPAQTPDPLNGSTSRKIEHMREEERHKRLQADTAKLVQLTNELKDEVDKTSKDELSVDVVRKASEIEKLAKDVRERMRS